MRELIQAVSLLVLQAPHYERRTALLRLQRKLPDASPSMVVAELRIRIRRLAAGCCQSNPKRPSPLCWHILVDIFCLAPARPTARLLMCHCASDASTPLFDPPSTRISCAQRHFAFALKKNALVSYFERRVLL